MYRLYRKAVWIQHGDVADIVFALKKSNVMNKDNNELKFKKVLLMYRIQYLDPQLDLGRKQYRIFCTYEKKLCNTSIQMSISEGS